MTTQSLPAQFCNAISLSAILLTATRAAAILKSVVMFLGMVSLLTTTGWTQTNTPRLELILAKDHVEGGFLGSEAVYADRKYVYLASYQGKLSILDRTKSDYPIVATIQVSAQPLRSVRGDQRYVYVTSGDGALYVFKNRPPFALVDRWTYSPDGYPFALDSLQVDKKSIIVSRSQGETVIDDNRVYLSQLNEGDVAVEIDKRGFAQKQVFGETFEPNVTVVFDRSTGIVLGSVRNPQDNRGRESFINLYAGNGLVIQTIPGCCGSGIYLYDALTLEVRGYIYTLVPNVVTMLRGLLVVGTEVGTVEVWDISNLDIPTKIASADLRALTGFTELDDIEIRSLWVDERSGLIFAGSSWGNGVSQGPTLPSFFVLQLK